MRVVILGVSGMLGSTAFRLLGNLDDLEVFGTARSADVAQHFDPEEQTRVRSGIDAENTDALISIFADLQPDIVVNCIGIVKQISAADDPLVALPLNSLLPHRLARMATLAKARLVHISTDCVFKGDRGNYRETDFADADDLYGRSKLLGEVDYPNAITLRTSIVGRELASRNGLVDWFLSQTGTVRGFTQAVFSGLTTHELSKVIAEHVLPRADLRGVFNVSVDPISKHDLLCHLREVYDRPVNIVPDGTLVIDRSLNSDRFRSLTQYQPPKWPQLVEEMRRYDKREDRPGQS